MRFLLLFITISCSLCVAAQTDSLAAKQQHRTYTHYDSVQLARLNTSGNLMLAAGVGLCGAGAYLIYEGYKVYNAKPGANSTDPAYETARNHRQGTIYVVAAGVGIAAAAVLLGFGARNKIDFKARKRMMELQSGLLNNGSLGIALAF